jgi:class 3 adenylate cyclase/AmiR/NasT family two-component response regulator
MMEGEKKLVLLVDDNPANLRIGKNVLSEKYTVATAPSADKMFSLLENNSPSIILLDIDMPEMNGYEAIKILKSKPETVDIPVIFLTARTETGDELEGLTLGAIDYITKPFQPPLLLKRLEVHLLVEDQRKILEKQAAELKIFNDNIRIAFSTYVSHDVVEEILADPSHLHLGGTKRNMTALFTDVRCFSTVSEKLDPEALVSLLNRYLSAMSDIILAEKGTIDKYEGDAIIAFFGAPIELKDHALRACLSAIAMKKIEREFNRAVMEQKLSPIPLFTRIGINTGDMVAGNMGTENKMNYTIMGNAVNLAARLEGVNKQYGTWALISEATVRETGNCLFTRKLDRVRVVGINEPVRLYELLDTAEQAAPDLKNMIEVFNNALDHFEKRNWKQALDGFKEVLLIKANDNPSKIYYRRSVEFVKNPPNDAWDGVYNLTTK